MTATEQAAKDIENARKAITIIGRLQSRYPLERQAGSNLAEARDQLELAIEEIDKQARE